MAIYRIDTETLEQQLLRAFCDGWCEANGFNFLHLSAEENANLMSIFAGSLTRQRMDDWQYHYDMHQEG